MTTPFSPRTISRWVTLSTIAAVGLAGTAAAQNNPPVPGPTTGHTILKQDVGTWDATMKVWIAPDTEPMISQCTETNELLPGGMWVVSRFEGELMDMEFVGVGTFGYDPVEKKYVGSWVDNMSPYMMTMRGDYDPETETMTVMAKSRDPETGKEITYKQVSRKIDDDTRLFEIFVPGEDGEDWKMLEVQYKRRAD